MNGIEELVYVIGMSDWEIYGIILFKCCVIDWRYGKIYGIMCILLGYYCLKYVF